MRISVLLRLGESDFLLAERCPEGFAAALAQADCKFCPFPCFVRSASHLPSFFRSYFFSTFGTFCHKFASMNVITDLSGTTNKTLPNKRQGKWKPRVKANHTVFDIEFLRQRAQ
jgi:hypothetical protein